MKKILILFVLLFILTLSACKIGKVYNVTFINGDEQEVVQYKHNKSVQFEELSKEGHTFNGWTLDGELVKNHKVTSDVTFVASFTARKYDIKFDTGSSIQTLFFSYGEEIDFPSAYKENMTFVGWTLNGQLVENYVVTQNVTFTALFTELNYIELAKTYLSNLFPEETTNDLTLPTEYNGVEISWKSSNVNAISLQGVVTQQEYKATVTLTATLKFNEESVTHKIKVIVPKLDDEVILQRVLDNYEFNSTIVNNKLALTTDFSTLNSPIIGTWESLDKEYLSDSGSVLTYLDQENEVSIKLTLSLREATVTKSFTVVIPAANMDEIIELALSNAHIDPIITSDKANLPTEFEYDLVGVWSSSDATIIDNEGNVNVNDNVYKEVKMTLTLKKITGEEVKTMEYTFKVNKKTHLPIVHASEFNVENMDNVELVNDRLVLKDGQTYGEYESDIIETISFDNCVPSWAAVTSTTATVEFQIRARVNGSWSKYITYCSGGWGLGLQNKASNQSDTLVKLSTDEFMVLNGKSSDAIQFKLILKRTSSTNDSPEVSLCSFALKGTSYTAPTYSLSSLPSNVKHVVPKLYQGAVPSIGNSICSPTSSTMLLKYKGLDFTAYDSQYEHRYIAGLARDYGNAIYGNWVYNTVAMSAYGFNSYVARFYSVAELCHHIANVGPVACSMKGQMTSDMKDYYTNGHLITIIGYEYNNGVLTLISNDPNVPSVECRYSEAVFTATWRNIVYVIE